ncbi:MAG TPA: TMEM175 family protein [Acidimicrobiales bacterium]
MNKGRLESFTDGVFAIAITLLVLTITPVADYQHLGHELAKRWPSLAAYVVSFAIIGIMWLNHHSIFAHIASADRGLVILNLTLLLTVAFLPFPTGIFGEALHRDQGARVAAVLYSATMALNAYAWAALWLHASVGRRLLVPAFPEAQRRSATLAFTGGTVAYTIILGVAFINAYACLALHGLMALYYALDPLTRRAARQAPAAAPADDPAG